MDSTLVLLFSLLCKLSDSAVLIPLVSIQLVIVFCLKTCGTDCASFSAPPGTIPSLRCPLLQLLLRRLPKPGPTPPPAFPLPQGARLPRAAPPRFRRRSLSHHRKTAVGRVRLPGRTTSQSGSLRLSGHRRPEGQRVKESVVTCTRPLLLKSDGRADGRA